MATIIYSSATEHVNKHVYDVMVQAHFTGIHPEVERGIFKTPIYEPFDHVLKQRSKITISKMVELFLSKSSFDIVHDKDVLYILHHIDAYVEEVYPLRSNPEIEKYIEKILKLRDRVYFTFCRVLKLHPTWKEAYEEQIGVFKLIAQLYRPLNSNTDLPETLLEDLRVCPTIRQNQRAPAQLSLTDVVPGPVIYDV